MQCGLCYNKIKKGGGEMQYYELARKKLNFIVTPEEIRWILNGFHHVVVNTGVPKNYTESDTDEFFTAYEKLYQKLKNGERVTDGGFSVGITAHIENCLYKPTSKLSVPYFAEPCPIIEPFCLIPFRGTLSTSFSVFQDPYNTCGLCLIFSTKIEYSSATAKHPSGIVTQDELDDFETYQTVVARIKSITKPLKLNYDEKSHRTSVRISAEAKRDIEKFYFVTSNGIEIE